MDNNSEYDKKIIKLFDLIELEHEYFTKFKDLSFFGFLGFLTHDKINEVLATVPPEDVKKIMRILTGLHPKLKIVEKIPLERVYVTKATNLPDSNDNKTKLILRDQLFELVKHHMEHESYDEFISGYILLDTSLEFVHVKDALDMELSRKFFTIKILEIEKYEELELAFWDDSELKVYTQEDLEELFISFISLFCEKCIRLVENLPIYRNLPEC